MAHLVEIGLPEPRQSVTAGIFTFALRRDRLRKARRREGRYLRRSNLGRENSGNAGRYYMQFSEVEQAFKERIPSCRVVNRRPSLCAPAFERIDPN